MKISQENIDGGKPFDWGRTSADYARFRDIYPPAFYDRITGRGLCTQGQRVLDLGTGTGVIPRALYHCGAEWTAIDLSAAQIEQAKLLAAQEGMKIDFRVSAAEALDFPPDSFDVVTACQCFWYFDHSVTVPRIAQLLRPHGKLVLLYMAWLPFEDPVAAQSEALVLKYNPGWSGAGETRKPIWIPPVADRYFRRVDHEEYALPVRFTRESWHGRMKACRGIGASLSEHEIAAWEQEHRALLGRIAPEAFDVLHYAAIAVLEKRDVPAL